VRWSKKRGRCKKTHSSKVGKMYSIAE
jgi:hypothetical protein